MDLTNTTIHQAACMQFVAASIYNWPEKQAFFFSFFLCVIVRVEQTLPPLFFRKSFAYHNPKRMHLCPSEKLFERKTGEEGPQPRYLSLCTSEHGAHTHTALHQSRSSPVTHFMWSRSEHIRLLQRRPVVYCWPRALGGPNQ